MGKYLPVKRQQVCQGTCYFTDTWEIPVRYSSKPICWGTHKELGALVAEQGQEKDPLREGRVAPLIHLQIILESFQIHSSTLQPHG